MKDTGGELRVKTSRLSVGVPIKDTDDIFVRVPLRDLGYRVKRGRGQRRNRRNREPLGDRRVESFRTMGFRPGGRALRDFFTSKALTPAPGGYLLHGIVKSPLGR